MIGSTTTLHITMPQSGRTIGGTGPGGATAGMIDQVAGPVSVVGKLGGLGGSTGDPVVGSWAYCLEGYGDLPGKRMVPPPIHLRFWTFGLVTDCVWDA